MEINFIKHFQRLVFLDDNGYIHKFDLLEDLQDYNNRMIMPDLPFLIPKKDMSIRKINNMIFLKICMIFL